MSASRVQTGGRSVRDARNAARGGTYLAVSIALAILAAVCVAVAWIGWGGGTAEETDDALGTVADAAPAAEHSSVTRVVGGLGTEEEVAEEQEEEQHEEVFADVIGTGGGSGRKFGGRYAGRRSLGAMGGAVAVSGESYAAIAENAWKLAAVDARSTFSVDVDSASYSNVRRHLESGRLPPADAVRIEELVNYFRYGDPPPLDPDRPLALHAEVASCPWRPQHRLARIALTSLRVPDANRQPANLVFLIDVSGSMRSSDKLPLLRRGLRMLVDRLGGRDRVAIVVYAGSAGLVLPSTACSDPEAVHAAIAGLEAGGSTAGGAGIRLAYDVAARNLVEGGVNRVILATDGDFNVGVTDDDELVALIREKAAGGIFLTVLGFGTGNLRDDRLERLADEGDGHYAYIDGLAEARKVLVEEIGATLVTVAKDVKLSVEFNPRLVRAHRLIGYENRVLAHRDFDDDRKDAGEVGAGHGVTALFEIVPAGVPFDPPRSPGASARGEGATEGRALEAAQPRVVESGAVQAPAPRPRTDFDGALMRVQLRWKRPGEEQSRHHARLAYDSGALHEAASDDLRFAAAVASFGMLLRRSPERGSATLASVRALAAGSLGDDPGGLRSGFLALLERAEALDADL